MKTTARTILSATIGIGLTAATVFTAATAGFADTSTTTAFSLLTVYGLFEITFGAPRPARFEIRHATAHTAEITTTELTPVRVAAIVEYPSAAVQSHAA